MLGFLTPQFIENKQALGLEVVTFRVVAASVPGSPSASADAAANKAALPEGWKFAIVSKADSVFTFTLTQPSQRAVVIVGAHVLTADRITNESTTSSTAFTVETTNLSGVAADADFHVTILRFESKQVF